MITFLYEFGLPYLSVRNAIRSNNHQELDVMWRCAYHWFRATNKTNYSVMAPQATLHTERVAGPFKRVWTEMRTASMLLHWGKNVAWDWVLERFNRDMKQGMGGHVTRERCSKYVKVLNSLKHIKEKLLAFLGISGHEGVYNIYKDTMIEAMKNYIASTLGGDPIMVEIGDGPTNPFEVLNRQGRDPLEVVHDKAFGAQNGTTWYDHAVQHMQTPVLPPLEGEPIMAGVV